MTTEHNRRASDLLAAEVSKRGFIIERQQKELAETKAENERLRNEISEFYDLHIERVMELNTEIVQSEVERKLAIFVTIIAIGAAYIQYFIN